MLVEYLKNIPLFKHLKDAQLKEIASRCKNASYRKSETIFYKTDPSTDLYIVINGKLKAVLSDEKGDEMVIAHFGEGDFFGELSLLDGKGRSATIVADKESELAVLRQDVFMDLLYKNPKIAVELMVTLVERLRKADEMIESLAFLEVGERLIRALLEEKELTTEPDGKYLRIKKLTHKELAGRIGSSREAVSKCIKMLSLKGFIKEVDDDMLVAQDAMQYLREAHKK